MSLFSEGSVETVRKVHDGGETIDERAERAADASLAGTSPRKASIQRLTAPVPVLTRAPGSSDSATAAEDGPLSGSTKDSPTVGPGRSAIAAALASYGRSPPQHGTPGTREVSPGPALSERAGLLSSSPGQHVSYGTPSQVVARTDSPRPLEDPEVVRRLLVQPEDVGRPHRDSSVTAASGRHESRAASVATSTRAADAGSAGPGFDRDDFSSLQLQGGDITRQIYRWAEGTDVRSIRNQRSRSFIMPRPETEEIQNVKQPGGLRRNYLDRRGRRGSPSFSESAFGDEEHAPRAPYQTSNFLEFLTLYGHFAGEELREDDEYDFGDENVIEEEGEDRPLLRRTNTAASRRRQKTLSRQHGNASAGNALATLLKSFVGTGVLFLPRAFMNGGMVFSSVVLLIVAALSYYCFILLVTTQLKVGGSFGDMGELLYGKTLRFLILASLVLSQVGFVSAYIVFVAENLRAFVEAVSGCTTFVALKWIILFQLVVLLPFSLIRRISKLAFTAYIADAFIVLGLIYLYGEDISAIVQMRGPSDIVYFNPETWTLFIGTAIFTFEGIGLILPIQESMREPRQFPMVLAGVMAFITVLFTSIGALSYAAFGSRTKTVILLNMPQDSAFVNAVQLLYSAAILLSTPLQLFPAIRILEQGLFRPSLSGRANPVVKWQKNLFRFILCAACALIAWGGADDLDKFVSLVGSFACIPLVYVYPPMLHYRAVAATAASRLADLTLCFFGVLFMAYTTVLTGLSWSKGSPPDPGFCDPRATSSPY